MNTLKVFMCILALSTSLCSVKEIVDKTWVNPEVKTGPYNVSLIDNENEILHLEYSFTSDFSVMKGRVSYISKIDDFTSVQKNGFHVVLGLCATCGDSDMVDAIKLSYNGIDSTIKFSASDAVLDNKNSAIEDDALRAAKEANEASPAAAALQAAYSKYNGVSLSGTSTNSMKAESYSGFLWIFDISFEKKIASAEIDKYDLAEIKNWASQDIQGKMYASIARANTTGTVVAYSTPLIFDLSAYWTSIGVALFALVLLI